MSQVYHVTATVNDYHREWGYRQHTVVTLTPHTFATQALADQHVARLQALVVELGVDTAALRLDAHITTLEVTDAT